MEPKTTIALSHKISMVNAPTLKVINSDVKQGWTGFLPYG